jgi:hypothetical protein
LPRFLTSFLLCAGAGGTAIASEIDVAKLPPAAARAVDFKADVYPLLKARCFRCHEGARAVSGERLDDRADILGEADGKPLAVAGKSAESLLVHAVAGALPDKVMPPEGERLSAAEVGILRAWIDQGLAWDDSLLPPPGAATAHWAFQPVARPEPPAVANAGWVRTPVDAFIAREHEARGLKPVPEASRRTLIRRLSLDLTGLPPSPEEAEAFAADSSPRACEELVERLLASPAYGERWGRHWLDVARFAETEGYENNNLRPFAWRYRDYVVKCFNEDRPFDRFLTEQLAGDELLPYSDENLIATGFLAAARLSGNEQDKAKQRNDMLVDVTNAAASAFLGLTLGCAQCHNHKFDPLTQRDYYRFQGYFVRGQVTNVLLEDPDLWRVYEAAIPAEYTAAETLREAVLARGRDRAREEARQKLAPELAAALATPFDRRAAAERELAARAERELAVPKEKAEQAVPEEDRKLYEELKKKVEALAKELPAKPQTWAFYSPATSPTPVKTLPIKGDYALPYEPEELKKTSLRLLIRGDPARPGPEVDAGPPAVFGEPAPGKAVPGTRRALAEWLTHPAHPLTARVWANRVWQYHFGHGLVREAGDFGVQSPRPVHGELLDWLASELVQSGWSTRHLHRLIVLSSAYRQSSIDDAGNARIDPENDLLWRWSARRLEAEAIRDLTLAASGELDRTAGGPAAPAGEEALRRSLYLLQKRDGFPEMQALFDGPPAGESCARRHVSTVALQPLYLLNSAFLTGRAAAFAGRVARAAGDDLAGRAAAAFRLALGRPPERPEMDAALAYFAADPGAPAEATLRRFCQVLLNLNEFVYLD